MAAQEIKIADILIPKGATYVRGHVDAKNLTDLTLIAKDPKHGNTWPYHTPVLLRKLPLLPKVETDTKGKKGTKGKKAKKIVAKLYVAVDGVTRITAYRNLKRKTVFADVESMSEKDADLRQFTTNLGHGLRINRAQRDTWLDRMRHVHKMRLAEIAKECGMTESYISRLCRKTYVTGKPRKPRLPKGAAAPKAPVALKPESWTLDTFVSDLRKLRAQIEEHAGVIQAYARQNAATLVKLLEPFTEMQNAALAVEAIKAH